MLLMGLHQVRSGWHMLIRPEESRDWAAFGIGCEYNPPEDVFMVVELHAGFLRGASGQANYHAAFSDL
jgi:predicted N-acetyltransferase YhbS